MGTSSRIKQIAYEQLKEYLVAAVYLWVVLGLFVVYKSVILAEQHISFVYHGQKSWRGSSSTSASWKTK